MNKLVIIGNGFDLAHKLPTSYSSFVNYIWENIWEKHEVEPFNDLVKIDDRFNYFKGKDLTSYTKFVNHVNGLNLNRIFEGRFDDKRVYKLIYKKNAHNLEIFKFKNKFFGYISIENIENWVDIENCYYRLLLDLVNNNSNPSKIISIDQLNKEFLQIKNILAYYLQTEIQDKFNFSYNSLQSHKILNEFEYRYKNLKNNIKNKYYNEFDSSIETRDFLIKFDERFTDQNMRNQFDFIHENLFLDFNYTPNGKTYVDSLNTLDSLYLGKSIHVQIHGNLHSEINKMNFGFGDEMDDHYKILENKNDNRYLENIKSFMYLLNSNYKNLLNWIESNEFQVFIMGHSCGLSDRTLLNTIFEHQNCKSIKIFYHEWEGGDNYKELTQNISRHFNKKTQMREKVVDKSLCIPLSQDVSYSMKIK